MKKNKEKEKNTNPYHKEYGVFSNSIHALKSLLRGFVCPKIESSRNQQQCMR